MGSCCKNGQSMEAMLDNDKQSDKSGGQKIIKYTLKLFGFALFMLILPFVIVYIVWLAFRLIVINSNIDLRPMLIFMANKFQENNNDEVIDDEYENLTEEDVVLLDVEDITNSVNKG